MKKEIFTLDKIASIVKPLAKAYAIDAVYLFGSYARGEADENSDLDFLVMGGKNFKRTRIFAFGEDLRELLQKDVDVFEISEINVGTPFYNAVMRDKVLVA